jgi:hypothetical protein
VKPARKIRKSYTTSTGIVVSSRDVVADFEGPLEMAFYLTCEFDCTVRDFASQPCVVEYTAPDGKPHSYYPDALLRFRPDRQGTVRRPWLVEVKKKQSIASEGNLHDCQTQAGHEKAAENGWTYHVLTEDQIYTPFWRNGKFLLRFLKEAVSREDCRAMDQCLFERGTLSMEELLQRTACSLLPGAAPGELDAKRTQLMPFLYARLVQRTLTANLTEHLTLQSQVWLPRDDDPTYSPFL